MSSPLNEEIKIILINGYSWFVDFVDINNEYNYINFFEECLHCNYIGLQSEVSNFRIRYKNLMCINKYACMENY